jgi:hypothetical protein
MVSEYPVSAREHHENITVILETQGGVVVSSRTVCDDCGARLS